MQAKKLVLINKRGLHARAATRLVQTCKQFQAQVQISTSNGQAQGQNIMQLLMLAAPCGTQLNITAQGQDAAAALAALEALINNRFDEQE